MKAVLFDFKTAKEPWFDLAEAVYVQKISHFINFQVQHLKTLKESRAEKDIKLKFETQELLKKVTNDDFVVVLDEQGKVFNTVQFSDLLTKIETGGKKRIVFVIGGAYGVSKDIKSRANITISMSGFVMNHLVAEVVLLEQIYRAYTIKNRIPYHNS